jgi:hypothetical protein
MMDASCFLELERRSDGGIHATRDHNKVISVMRNAETLREGIQNERRGMLTYSVMFLHDNARLHTTNRTRALLKNFSLGLFDNPPYNTDLSPSHSYLFTYLKNWLRSQRFNSNEELMVGVKTWLSSLAADILTQENKNTFPVTSASIPAMTALRSSLNMYMYFICTNLFS